MAPSLDQVLTNCLQNQPFLHAKVPIWTSTIVENCLKELAVANTDSQKPGAHKFKYVGELLQIPWRRLPAPLDCRPNIMPWWRELSAGRVLSLQ